MNSSYENAHKLAYPSPVKPCSKTQAETKDQEQKQKQKEDVNQNLKPTKSVPIDPDDNFEIDSILDKNDAQLSKMKQERADLELKKAKIKKQEEEKENLRRNEFIYSL